MEYSPKVMEHFANPRNMGAIDDADGVGTVGNAKCGDIMKVYLKIEDGIINDAGFKTFGCGAAVATSSIATELVKGKTLQEALEITNKAVMDALGGLPAAKQPLFDLGRMDSLLDSPLDDGPTADNSPEQS